VKKITWGCDVCRKEANGVSPPFGWVESSYFDQRAEKYRRFVFCSYKCLDAWALGRHKYDQSMKEEKQNEIPMEQTEEAKTATG
jgi:hypothetical protein